MCSKLLSNNPNLTPQKFRRPVMVVHLRKGQKIFKNFANNCKFKQNLAKIRNFIILRTISFSQETIQYPCLKRETVSLAHKDPYSWYMIKIFRKFEKKIKILSKNY